MRIVGVRRAWFTKIFAERAAIIDMPFQLLPATLLYCQHVRDVDLQETPYAQCKHIKGHGFQVSAIASRVASVWALPLGP